MYRIITATWIKQCTLVNRTSISRSLCRLWTTWTSFLLIQLHTCPTNLLWNFTKIQWHLQIIVGILSLWLLEHRCLGSPLYLAAQVKRQVEGTPSKLGWTWNGRSQSQPFWIAFGEPCSTKPMMVLRTGHSFVSLQQSSQSNHSDSSLKGLLKASTGVGEKKPPHFRGPTNTEVTAKCPE